MSRLGDIADNAETLIAAMTTIAGYSANWSSTNELDESHVTAYPSALVDIVEETALEMIVHSGAYTNEATMVVRVRDKITTSERYPQRAIRDNLYSRLDDLKKLFGSTDLDGVAMCDYQGFTIEPTSDTLTAGRMDVRFRLTYSQDRTNPANPAC
jgi:hypothetical protein